LAEILHEGSTTSLAEVMRQAPTFRLNIQIVVSIRKDEEDFASNKRDQDLEKLLLALDNYFYYLQKQGIALAVKLEFVVGDTLQARNDDEVMVEFNNARQPYKLLLKARENAWRARGDAWVTRFKDKECVKNAVGGIEISFTPWEQFAATGEALGYEQKRRAIDQACDAAITAIDERCRDALDKKAQSFSSSSVSVENNTGSQLSAVVTLREDYQRIFAGFLSVCKGQSGFTAMV
jgi:hypothetical protein